MTMNLTPQSMRSPVSPFDDQAKHAFESRRNCAYPTPHPEPSPMAESARGLGIYDCSMPHQQSTVQALPPSPQQSESWSHSSMVEQDPYPQTTQPPNIFTAAYDPFSDYPNNSHMISAASDEAPGLVYCQTPPSTNMPSHRSSVSSSCSPPHQHAEYYGSRVKAEEPNWYPSPENDHILQRSLTTQSFPSYSSGVTAIHGSTEDLYKSPTGDWAKATTAPYPMDLQTDNLIGEEIRARFDGAPVLPSVNRIKKKRQRTTPEEATHECRVCGKLFKRSYNWKSHMETHNPDRKYPHPCTADVNGQRCSKKFQRKTDLDRHHDSVHLKAKNHRCNLCGNRFARRDTLRRHTEDGCPKRFEVGLRESVPPVQRWPLQNYPRDRAYSLNGTGMPPPMAHPASAQPPQTPFFHRQPEFVSSPLQTTTTHSVFAQ